MYHIRDKVTMAYKRYYSDSPIILKRHEQYTRALDIFVTDKEPKTIFVELGNKRLFEKKGRKLVLAFEEFIWLMNMICLKSENEGHLVGENSKLRYSSDNYLNLIILFQEKDGATKLNVIPFNEMQVFEALSHTIKRRGKELQEVLCQKEYSIRFSPYQDINSYVLKGENYDVVG